MSVLDKTIPFFPVLMVLEKNRMLPDVHLPEGYHFQTYDPSYQDAWINLHTTLGEFQSYEEGKQYFEKTFYDLEKVKRYFLLIVDKDKKLAGTSSIWIGNHFGVERYRVHWLGIDPFHQRKGLAKALLIKTMQLYKQTGRKEPLYLTSQTNSYVGISLYLKMGFVPYKGEMPVNFHANKETYQEDNEKAWKLIYQKIKEMNKK